MNTKTQEVTGAVTTANALKMAIEMLSGEVSLDVVAKVIQACKEALASNSEALAQPSNMVTVPADKLEKMQKELKRLRKKVQEVKDKETNRSWGVFS